MIVLHVTGGLLSLAAGALALLAPKGGALHRKSGLVFVVAMLFMASTGAVMGALGGELVNVVAGSLTFYLVVTALLTFRRPRVGARWLDLGGLLLALLVVLVCVYGVASAAIGGSVSYAPVYVMFGSVATLAAVGDVRLLLAPRLKATARLIRHLWRMCFALWIATASFFLGQADVIPEPFRIRPLLALPVLLVLGLLVFWLVRVRFTAWRPRAGRVLMADR